MSEIPLPGTRASAPTADAVTAAGFAASGGLRYAVRAGARFAELGAGILRRQPGTEQDTRLAYYFGGAGAGVRHQSRGTSRVFSGVFVPGDAAQGAIADAAAGGAALDLLCWREGAGGGFMVSAVPTVDSDGTAAVGGEGIRFTLAECGPRRRGTVYAEGGAITFAPLAGDTAGATAAGGAGSAGTAGAAAGGPL